MSNNVPLEKFGSDHWSVFAYAETCCVDHFGVPTLSRMRCDEEKHPEYVHVRLEKKYPTRLKNKEELYLHDDWDCIDDLQAAGLLIVKGTTMRPEWELTDKGYALAAKLRMHKAKGGTFGDFPGE